MLLKIDILWKHIIIDIIDIYRYTSSNKVS